MPPPWPSQAALVAARRRCSASCGEAVPMPMEMPAKIWDDRKPLSLSIVKPHDGQAVYSVAFLTAPECPNRIDLITVVKIWDDCKPVHLSILKPHDGQAVYSVTFLTTPERPNLINLITAGPLNQESKLWASTNKDGWLRPSDSETWNCTQTLGFVSSLEPRADVAFFNQVTMLPLASLILLANSKKNAVYAVHVEHGPDPSSSRLDYRADFTIAMPFVSLPGTHESQCDGEQAVQVYRVQTMATQEYGLELPFCSCRIADTTGFGRDHTTSCVLDAPLEVVGTKSSRGTSFPDSYYVGVSSKSSTVDQSAEVDLKPSTPPLACSEDDGFMHLPSAPFASKMELPGSRPAPRTKDIYQSVLVYATNRGMECDALRRQDRPMPIRNTELGHGHVDFAILPNPRLMFQIGGNATHLVPPSEIISGNRSSAEISADETQSPSDGPTSDCTGLANKNALKKYVEMPERSDHSSASNEFLKSDEGQIQDSSSRSSSIAEIEPNHIDESTLDQILGLEAVKMIYQNPEKTQSSLEQTLEIPSVHSVTTDKFSLDESQSPYDGPTLDLAGLADGNALKKFVEMPERSDYSSASREQLYMEEKVLHPETSGQSSLVSAFNSTEPHEPWTSTYPSISSFPEVAPTQGMLQQVGCIPIFVRHVSGELALTVNLDHPSRYLMHIYEQKTKTNLDCQYFVYGKTILEPDVMLRHYRLEQNTTVHVCARLVGGAMTIDEYLTKNQGEILEEVTLPDGRVSLNMTKGGCLFLSSLLKCFTRTFAARKTWHGNFTLKFFSVINNHVEILVIPEGTLNSSSMRADLGMLVKFIKKIFYRNKVYLISKFPPYLENLMTFLGKLKGPVLYDSDRVFIETHMCCVESIARGMLLVALRKKYKSLKTSEKNTWSQELEDFDQKTEYKTFENLREIPVFKDVIQYAEEKKEGYGANNPSTFRLMRDGFMHGPSNRLDKTVEPWKEKFKNNDGIELMIPAYNPDFIPNMIYCLIQSNTFDIKEELLAAQVRCICRLCHLSRSGYKDKKGDSSKVKGKQPVLPTQQATSAASSQGASPVQSSSPSSSRFKPSPSISRRSSSDSPTVQSASSSRLSSPSPGTDRGSSFADIVKSKSLSPTVQLSSSSSSRDAKGRGKGNR